MAVVHELAIRDPAPCVDIKTKKPLQNRKTKLGRQRGVCPSGVLQVSHSDDEWRQLLTPAQYKVLRQQGTERPLSSPLYKV
jgi:hypothetical protein